MNQQSRYITFKSFKRGGILSELQVLLSVSLECYGSLVPERIKVHKMTARFTKKTVSEKYLGVILSNQLDQGSIVMVRLQDKCKS